jgi:hypothetical protein
MRKFVLLLCSILIIGCEPSHVNNPISPTTLPTIPWENTMISKQQINEMFETIREQTDWKIDEDMLWSYFFFDVEQRKIEALAKELSSLGYSVADISKTSDNLEYVLRIEKVETHTPETLFERNLQFYGLARKFGIQSYDGMDVGPVK